jgi:hypothetical protein
MRLDHGLLFSNAKMEGDQMNMEFEGQQPPTRSWRIFVYLSALRTFRCHSPSTQHPQLRRVLKNCQRFRHIALPICRGLIK